MQIDAQTFIPTLVITSNLSLCVCNATQQQIQGMTLKSHYNKSQDIAV